MHFNINFNFQNDKQRKEAVRQWRDEQISSLENLERRTIQEDEKLRALKLEREFQRRAEEAKSKKIDDDDEDGEEDEDDHREDRNALEEEQQKRDYRPGWSGASVTNNNPGWINNPDQPQLQNRHSNGHIIDEDQRARKADEIRRKQQEFEAAHEAEEKLLREAAQRRMEEERRRHEEEKRRQQQEEERRRQEEERRRQEEERRRLEEERRRQQQERANRYSHHQQEDSYRHDHHASQRLDTLVNATSYTNGPTQQRNYHQQNHNIDNDNHLHHIPPGEPSPVPPERGSSYSIMQHTHIHSNSNSKLKTPEVNATTTVKRVQFSETPIIDSQMPIDSNANIEKPNEREDPNVRFCAN